MTLDQFAPAFKQVVLQKIKFALAGRVANSLIESISVGVSPELHYRSDEVAYRIAGMVLSNDVDVQETEEVVETHSFPSTWWDYTKGVLREKSPGWLRPVFARLTVRRYEVPTVKRITRIERHCCPHIETPSNDARHVVFMTTPALYSSERPTAQQVTRLVAPDGRTSIIDTAAWDRENCDPRASIRYAERSLRRGREPEDDIELHISTTDARRLMSHPSMRPYSFIRAGVTRSGIPKDFMGCRVIEIDDRAGGAQ